MVGPIDIEQKGSESIIHDHDCDLKVRLCGTRQAARLAHDMLQHDLLHDITVYMVGTCRARLLHSLHEITSARLPCQT